MRKKVPVYKFKVEELDDINQILNSFDISKYGLFVIDQRYKFRHGKKVIVSSALELFSTRIPGVADHVATFQKPDVLKSLILSKNEAKGLYDNMDRIMDIYHRILSFFEDVHEVPIEKASDGEIYYITKDEHDRCYNSLIPIVTNDEQDGNKKFLRRI
jgi:hypothetical protein